MKLWPFGRGAATEKAARIDAAASIFVGGTPGSAEWPDDNYAAHALSYSRNSLVFACINEVATSAADARLVLQSTSRDGGTEEVTDGPLAALLRQPNPGMSQVEFVEALHAYRLMAGNAYVFKERNRAPGISGLYLLRPDRMRVVPGMAGPESYTYTVDGSEYRLAAPDVGHIKTFSPTHDWYGLSPLQVIAREVGLDLDMTAFTRTFFSNAGVPYGLLKLRRKLADQAEANAIRSKWRAQFARMRGWHQVAVLDEDAEYQQMGSDPDKLTMPDLRALTETRICMAFGVPPILVGAKTGLDRSTYANYREARESLWEETLLPAYKRLQGELTRVLAPEFPELAAGRVRLAWDFSEVRALQDDEDKKTTRTLAQWEKGLISRDEARATLGYDPAPTGMGRIWVMPGTWTEMGPDVPEAPVAEKIATPTVNEADDLNRRVNAAAQLIRAGFKPDAALLAMGLPAIDHVGLLPVTLAGAAEAAAPPSAEPPALPAAQQPPALPAPGKGWQNPIEKTTARERRLLAALAASRAALEERGEKDVAAYFRRLLNRVDGVIGRHLSRGLAETKELPFGADDLLPTDADTELQRLMRELHTAIAEGSWGAINDAGVLGIVPFDAGTPPVQRLLADGATRVVGINDATRGALRLALEEGIGRGYSLQQIANGVPADGYPGVRSLITELYKNRALTIARTEVGTAQNQAAAARYAASGVTEVLVMDGDEDAPCAAVNGTRQSIQWAAGNPLAHPNCVRAVLPVVEIPARVPAVETSA